MPASVHPSFKLWIDYLSVSLPEPVLKYLNVLIYGWTFIRLYRWRLKGIIQHTSRSTSGDVLMATVIIYNLIFGFSWSASFFSFLLLTDSDGFTINLLHYSDSPARYSLGARPLPFPYLLQPSQCACSLWTMVESLYIPYSPRYFSFSIRPLFKLDLRTQPCYRDVASGSHPKYEN